MKRCPVCGREYRESYRFCQEDAAALVEEAANGEGLEDFGFEASPSPPPRFCPCEDALMVEVWERAFPLETSGSPTGAQGEGKKRSVGKGGAVGRGIPLGALGAGDGGHRVESASATPADRGLCGKSRRSNRAAPAIRRPSACGFLSGYSGGLSSWEERNPERQHPPDGQISISPVPGRYPFTSDSDRWLVYGLYLIAHRVMGYIGSLYQGGRAGNGSRSWRCRRGQCCRIWQRVNRRTLAASEIGNSIGNSSRQPDGSGGC